MGQDAFSAIAQDRRISNRRPRCSQEVGRVQFRHQRYDNLLDHTVKGLALVDTVVQSIQLTPAIG
jgi:hypothetical protein